METLPEPHTSLVERAADFLTRILHFMPLEAPDHMSEHYRQDDEVFEEYWRSLPEE